MAVHTISILFPSYYSDFIHLSLNFVSYKLSKIFQAIIVIVFQRLKYCGKMPKFILSKPNIIWILKVISTSLCHVRKTIKRNKHEQKDYTLKKRLFLAANYKPMISQPLPRVFTFYNMAKAGKENQYEFSVLPVTAILENDKGPGAKMYYGRYANGDSFHLDTGDPTQNYRQRNAFQIKDFV